MWEMDDGLSNSNVGLKKNKLGKTTSRSFAAFLNNFFSLEFDSNRMKISWTGSFDVSGSLGGLEAESEACIQNPQKTWMSG